MYADKAKKLQTLRNILIEKGFQVRRHCCEYFLIKNNKFIGVLSLFPSWNQALLVSTNKQESQKVFPEILQIIKELFPEIKVELQG